MVFFKGNIYVGARDSGLPLEAWKIREGSTDGENNREI